MKKILFLIAAILFSAITASAAYPTPFLDLNGKYGYKSPTGQTVIRAKYDNALSFREGYAAVEIHGKWGFINLHGRTVARCIYNEVRDFNYGYAIVCQDGKWGAIDTKGKLIIPCMFDTAGEVSDAKVYIMDDSDDSGSDKKQ